MSPGVMRLIFGGFAVVMAGVVINTLLLQPEVTPALASLTPSKAVTTPNLPARSAIAAQSASVGTKPGAVAAKMATVQATTPEAPVETSQSPIKDTVRIARLTTDSAQPTRMPYLPEAEGDPDVNLRVQKELLSRGYGPIVANGIIGPLSRAAIMAYEYDNALPVTGEATEILLKRMREGSPANRQLGPEARKIRSPEAEQVVRTVQHSLTTLGYEPGRINGRMVDETERAIRAFEAANGMQSTGRVSAELFSLLARAMGARSAKISP
jgi:Putative peptidoglycan binding domain